MVSVWVAGVPKGQPRGRAFVTGGRARIFTPGTAEAWKGDIARAFEAHLPREPWGFPVELKIDFFLQRPKRLCRRKDPDHPIPCDGLPDWDNAGKAASDALVHLGMIADDKQICFAQVNKWYTSKIGYGTGTRRGHTGAVIRLIPIRGPSKRWNGPTPGPWDIDQPGESRQYPLLADEAAREIGS